MALNQEKARLKARSLASAGAVGAETAAIDASIENKKVVIKQLTEKVEELTADVSIYLNDFNVIQR